MKSARRFIATNSRRRRCLRDNCIKPGGRKVIGFFHAVPEHAWWSRISDNNEREDIVRTFLIAAASLAIASLVAVTNADARGYKYCLKSSPGPGDCKYSSYRQCMASASGLNAICVRNYGPRR